MVLRFAGFELDQQRAELRGRDGEAIKLRPKTLTMMTLFATNAGRVLSKQELIEAVWPNVHVGEDGLFQCVRELRTALGDDQRQMIKLVSGRGYLFEADVSQGAETSGPETRLPTPVPADADPAAEPAPPRAFGRRHGALAAAGFGTLIVLAIVTTLVRLDLLVGRAPPTIEVLPITAVADSPPAVASMAANVTADLSDGLAKIDTIRVKMPQGGGQPASRAKQADFVVTGELEKGERSWDVRMRMTRTTNGEVVWTAPVSIATDDTELSLQQTRLTAAIGHPLALRLSALYDANGSATSRSGTSGGAKVAIEQATASIMQTTRERFTVALTMLEKARTADPDNVDLAVALAALQLRGIQMVWYNPTDSALAERNAGTILEQALRSKPRSVPVLEAYCRFLNTTNQFVESLMACARTLSFDPWNGLALYHIGLAQLQLGRFDDALATFKQADRFDTPQVSRWTWRLGVGMTYLLMGRNEDALPWLQSSIAITPASGRSYMLLAAAYQGLGQSTLAKTTMDQALALRPGSTTSNVALPTKNASPVFLAASAEIQRAFIAAGLPER